MLMVAPLFATFYSEYLNSYELVNSRSKLRIAMQMDVHTESKEKQGILVHVWRQMLFGWRAWQIY